MGDSKEEFAVVRQQQEPGGLAIEPADRDHALRHVDQIEHRSAPALVGGGRNITRRLVQHEIAPALPLDELPVDPDLLSRRVNSNPQLAHDRPVDTHAPFNNHLLCAPA